MLSQIVAGDSLLLLLLFSHYYLEKIRLGISRKWSIQLTIHIKKMLHFNLHFK